jgi:hypothetical protein
MMTMPRPDPQRGIAVPEDCGDGEAPPVRRACAGLTNAAWGILAWSKYNLLDLEKF